MAVAVGQQGQETCVLHGDGQLTLVARLGAGDAAGNDLAGFGNVLAQQVEVLVVDLDDILGGETAEFLAAEELGHDGYSGIRGLQEALDIEEPLSSALRSPRSPRSACSPRPPRSSESSPPTPPSSSRRRRSPLSSLFVMIADISVTASSRLTTRWRSTASLKRKPDSSSSRTVWLTSMFNRT